MGTCQSHIRVCDHPEVESSVRKKIFKWNPGKYVFKGVVKEA